MYLLYIFNFKECCLDREGERCKKYAKHVHAVALNVFHFFDLNVFLAELINELCSNFVSDCPQFETCKSFRFFFNTPRRAKTSLF